ncbi:MAG: D-alanyl-D-alanine carboxypeptidase [Chthoniobacterales bacterium]|nr:D-alanyl-D-alanine carboxypeptidase [Chthoniobacterales bacterium]
MKLYCYLFFFLAATSLQAGAPPEVRGASVVVIDANNGNVLFSRNPNEQRPVGSTQKLLTALIVVEHGDLNHRVTIEPIDEATEPTMMGLRPGDTYSRQELLTALLVHSANDAARTLARDQAGSLENFAVLMNEKATQLGATSSHFVNPNGLPAYNQYSTAADMAKIGFAAYHNPTIRNIVSTKYYSFHQPNGRIIFLKNTNHTLLDNFFCNGMKTGYTDKSKHCLITSGSYQGHEAITVILGSTNRSQLFRDSAALLAWALGLRTLPVAAIERTSSAIENSPRRRPHRWKHHKQKKHTVTSAAS